MLQNAYLEAKIGVDLAENESRKECTRMADHAHGRGADAPGHGARAGPRAGLHALDHVVRRRGGFAEGRGAGAPYEFQPNLKNFANMFSNFSNIFIIFSIQYSIFEHF